MRVARYVAAALIVSVVVALTLWADVETLLHPRTLVHWTKTVARRYMHAVLSLEDCRVSLSGRTATFSKIRVLRSTNGKLDARVDRLRVRLGTDPLGGGIGVRHVSFDAPYLGLTITEDWRTPLEGMFDLPESERETEAPVVSGRLRRLRMTLPLREGGAAFDLRGVELGVMPHEKGRVRIGLRARESPAGPLSAGVTLDGEAISGWAEVGPAEVSRLSSLLPESVAEWFDKLQLSGRFRLRLSLGGTLSGPVVGVHIALEGGSLLVPETRLALRETRLEAEGVFADGKLRLSGSGVARLADGPPVRLLIELAHDEGFRLTITGRAEDVKVSERLVSRLPTAAQDVVSALGGRGSLDVTTRLELTDEGPPSLRFDFAAREETSIAVKWFPTRVDRLHGGAVWDGERVLVDAVSGWKGGEIRARGVVGTAGGELDLVVSGRDIPVCKEILDSLPEGARETTERLKASGRLGFVLRVRRTDSNRPVTFQVRVPLDGLRLVPQLVPVPVRVREGEVVVGAGGVMVRGVRGDIHGGSIRCDDFFVPFGGGDFMVRVNLDDLRVDGELTDTICRAFGLGERDWDATGLADAELRFVVREGGVRYDGLARLRNLSLRYAPFPVPLTEGEGLLLFEPERVTIAGLRGRTSGGSAVAWGEVTKKNDEWNLRARIEAYDLVVDKRLRDALPKGVQEYFDTFQPRGRADFGCRLDGPPKALDCRLVLGLRRCAVSIPEFKYPVVDASGSVLVDVGTGSVVIRDMTARDGAIVVNGSSTAAGGTRNTSLRIVLRGLPVDGDLVDALPASPFFDELHLSGGVSGSVNVKITQTGDKTSLRVSARLHPVSCSAAPGVLLDRIGGTVAFTVTADDGGSRVSPISLDLRGIEVEGIKIDRISAMVKILDDGVRVENLQGEVYGGALSGRVTTEGGKVKALVQIEQASVRRAAEHVFKKKMPKATGRVNVTVSAIIDDKNNLSGWGKVRMRDANLWEVPFFSILVKAFSLGQVAGVPFSRAGCKFKIENNRLKFRDVYFKSAILGLEGVGSLYFGGRLRFRFAVRFGVTRYLPLVGDVIDFIQDNLFQILVHGTAKDPTIKTVPFRPIAEFFKSEDE